MGYDGYMGKGCVWTRLRRRWEEVFVRVHYWLPAAVLQPYYSVRDELIPGRSDSLSRTHSNRKWAEISALLPLLLTIVKHEDGR